MNISQVLYMNENAISATKKICVDTAMLVCKDTEGVIDVGVSNTAEELTSDLAMINTIVEHELTRRYGA